jgi:hypothetical protein
MNMNAIILLLARIIIDASAQEAVPRHAQRAGQQLLTKLWDVGNTLKTLMTCTTALSGSELSPSRSGNKVPAGKALYG